MNFTDFSIHRMLNDRLQALISILSCMYQSSGLNIVVVWHN